MRAEILEAQHMFDVDVGAYVVLICRADDNFDPNALRQLHEATDDPVEARIAWDAVIYCPKDMGCELGKVYTFKREAQAKRVAARANKTIKELKAGKPPVEGVAAQMVYIQKGGKAHAVFALPSFVAKAWPW